MTCLFFLIREAFSFFRKSGSILDIVFFFLKIRNFKANILRSREQCKQTCLICIAEAPQDMWRSQISKKPRACPEAPQDMWRSQISKKPRACAEAPQDMWRSQISKKPRACQRRRYRICGEAKYTQKPRAMQMNSFNLHSYILFQINGIVRRHNRHLS